MAEFNFTKELNNNIFTGGNDKDKQLYYQLKKKIHEANQIDIIVSFVMESGVKMILDDLQEALQRNVKIRILTGNYLGITQPSALYLIKDKLGDKIDLRFYNETNRSFHPKSYIFHFDDKAEIFVGSSNISKSALTSGIEWNYCFDNLMDENGFNSFYRTFVDLFENHSIIVDDVVLKKYAKSWHKPILSKNAITDISSIENKKSFQPRSVQIEALYALKKSRAEGANKALVQAATGIGKTYLAAFDSKEYETVLFVAHREEILKQAATSFENVRNSKDYGFFNGDEKETNKAVIFASVASLGKDEYLNDEYFASDYFKYIVIDEFHHAVNDQYLKIIDYFKPKFMLGLTATPDRLDGKNIYEICDYNVPYEISLKEAINKGILVPFHYYGIYDQTDYSKMHLLKGRYNENELNDAYIGNINRNDLIYKYYQKYNSKRALGFCCSRKHAEEMAKDFCSRGISAVAVYSNASGTFSEVRDEAIRKLRAQEIKVIFSVDMFNEGLDIAEVDMVMFLRPTESPIVYMQQLGRGLRTAPEKEYLNVLDFIGNYEKAGRAPLLLRGINESSELKNYELHEIEYPDNCLVDFDIHLIDLFKELDKKKLSMKKQIINQYYYVKDYLGGKVPTRMELFTYMDDNVYEYCIKHAKENPFRKYLDFLNELNQLTAEEKKLYTTIAKEFLSVVETTDMQKVYKMPILYAFYNNGNIKLKLNDEDIVYSWKKFFDKGTNWKDFNIDITYEKYKEITDKLHLKKAKEMPIKFLKASGKGFFIDKDDSLIALREDLENVITNIDFKKHMKDILDYRTMEYYRRRYKNL